MLVHRRVTPPPPSIKFASTQLYTCVERGTVRVKCLAQEHNTMSPATAQTRTTWSGDKRTNHETTAPLSKPCLNFHSGTYSLDLKINLSPVVFTYYKRMWYLKLWLGVLYRLFMCIRKVQGIQSPENFGHGHGSPRLAFARCGHALFCKIKLEIKKRNV